VRHTGIRRKTEVIYEDKKEFSVPFQLLFPHINLYCPACFMGQFIQVLNIIILFGTCSTLKKKHHTEHEEVEWKHRCELNVVRNDYIYLYMHMYTYNENYFYLLLITT
jgi:hypothetical protein